MEDHKSAYREIAQNMGLSEVVCMNATRLVRDPMSKLRQEDQRLWLELQWIVSQEK
ncbi:MAG: hypothetical protein F6K09_31695 [Merismopedia sp. SIO2A8]|nr:hypothetical protein [Merismopedia sp. SIO2A8]